jgi:hypothetical protein
MTRSAFITMSLVGVTVAGMLAYSLGSEREPPVAAERIHPAISDHPTPVAPPEPAHVEPTMVPPAQLTTAQAIADTTSPDPRSRAVAIEALAIAPRSQAIPALESVLETGEPQVDRQIALQSLHTLALRQGDADGAIRDVLRGAIYHGDDEGAAQSAQAVLEDIEVVIAADERR